VTLRRAAGSAVAAAVLAAPAVLGLLPGTEGELSGGRAAAVGGPQFCTEGDAVTVVVDLRGLDPDAPVLVRCAEGPAGSGHSGFDALADAGLSYVMPDRQPGVVCRLATSTGLRPAPGEEIPVRGDDYVERCVSTPPAAAYWSYWHAPQGGRWQYSSSGPGNRSTIPGGFEGWSFSLNRSPSAAPPPRVAPDNPNAPYDGGNGGNGNGGNGNGGNGNGGNGNGGNGNGGNGNGGPEGSSGPTTAPTTPGPSATPGTDPDREPGGKAENRPGDRNDKGSDGKDGQADDGRSDPAETAPPEDTTRSDVTLTGDVPAATTADESGPPLGTVVGIGALAVLAAAVGLVAWRRRHRGAHLP